MVSSVLNEYKHLHDDHGGVDWGEEDN